MGPWVSLPGGEAGSVRTLDFAGDILVCIKQQYEAIEYVGEAIYNYAVLY